MSSLSNIELGTIKNQITELQKLNLKEVEFETLLSQIENLMHGYKTITRQVKASPLFRARKNNTRDNFLNVSELIYRPSTDIRDYGRLNKPSQSIFYGASNQDTAILELSPKVGDEITILRSDFFSDRFVHVMEIGDRERRLAKNHKTSGDFHKRLFGVDDGLKNKLIHDFLYSQFIQKVNYRNKYLYKITAAISNIFVIDTTIDGLLYPSIATNKKGTNIGLKPQVYDRFYTPKECWKIRVLKELSNLTYEVLCIAKAASIRTNGSITW